MSEQEKSLVAAIGRLGSEDAEEREQARATLTQAGNAATWHLIGALHPCGDEARRGALKVLAQIADPASADALLENLAEEDSGRRWQAAEGLVALGEVGLLRVLELLQGAYPSTDALLRGTHHVLTGLGKVGFATAVAPVLHAFQAKDPAVDLPLAALQARTALRNC